jgi:hypothetical protein
MSLAAGMAADLMRLVDADSREIAVTIADEWPRVLELLPEDYRECIAGWRRTDADADEDSRFDRALSRAASVRMPEAEQEEPEVQQTGIFGQPEPRTKRRRK